MANAVPPGPHRGLAGVGPPEETPETESAQALIESLSYMALGPSGGSPRSGPPAGFVVHAAMVLAFVFGLLVYTKLTPSQVLQITSGATAISVAGFYGRNAFIVIGRRMINGPGKQ